MAEEKLTFNEFTGEMIKLKKGQKNQFTYKELVKEMTLVEFLKKINEN